MMHKWGGGGGKVPSQCSKTTTFQVKGEPKQNQTEVDYLTGLAPFCWTKLAHIVEKVLVVVDLFNTEISIERYWWGPTSQEAGEEGR